MPATSTFCFDGFTLRPTGGTDFILAEKWTMADPAHRDTTSAWFWLEQTAGVESYLLEDRFGPVFFFKMMRRPGNRIELHLQFSPCARGVSRQADQRSRTMRALTVGMKWIEKILSYQQIDELFFVSENPNLSRFTEKRLGFTRDGNRLAKAIPHPALAENVR